MNQANESSTSPSKSPLTIAGLANRLVERGIAEAAASAGWRTFQLKRTSILGWSYPIYDPVTEKIIRDPVSGKPILRWKNYNEAKQGGEKYLWPFGQKGCRPYYVLPGTRAAIAEAGGEAFVAAGEIDVLTYISAGHRNVVCWLNGEGSVPSDLAEVLASLGVTKLLYFADLDAAGERSAQRLMQALRNTLIEVNAYRLPSYVGEKGDINDLWRLVRFDSARFTDELKSVMETPTARIEARRASASNEIVSGPHGRVEPAKTNAPGSRREPFDMNAEYRRWVKQEVLPLLDSVAKVVSGKPDGGLRHCPSPSHEDRHPSFRISYDRDTETGIPQCSCNIQHQRNQWDTVASWVGARSFKDWFKAQKTQNLNSPRREVKKRQTDGSPEGSEASETISTSEEFGLEETEFDPSFGGIRLGGTDGPPTDDEIGDKLIAKMDSRYSYFYGQWYRYENGVWLVEENIDRLAWEAMKAGKVDRYRPKKSSNASVQEYVRAELRVSDSVVDQGRRYINLRNGMYDLESLSLVDHNRELYLTSQLGFEYDPNATCPNWYRFLASATRDVEGRTNDALIALLQESMGYSLTAETYLEKTFWLKGRPGTGKTTVLRVLRALVGNAGTTLDLNTVNTTDSYQLASLRGKRVATCSEVKVGVFLPENLLKTGASGEEARVREIREKSQVVQLTAKIWWAMNHMPANRDDSGAIERRLIILPLDHIVPQGEKDVRLFDTLLTVLPGIFNWALEGWRRLRQSNTFTQVAQSASALGEFSCMTNPFVAFLRDEEWCVQGTTLRTTARDLASAYNAYASEHGLPTETEASLGRRWRELGVRKIKSGPENYLVLLTDRARTAISVPRR